MSYCARNYISSGHPMDARSARRRRMTNAYAALAAEPARAAAVTRTTPAPIRTLAS